MKIELKPIIILAIVLSVCLIGLVLFSGGRYVIDKKTQEFRDSTSVLNNNIKSLKEENEQIEGNYIKLEKSADSLSTKIREQERDYKRDLESLEERLVSIDTMDSGEQQLYFDSRYSSDLTHVVHIDSIQANRAIKDIEERDGYLEALISLERIHVTYKQYALQAGRMISNREEIIANLNEEIVAKDGIIALQLSEIKRLDKKIKRQKFKTKATTIVGIAIISGLVIITSK